jgi:hypothetical protein
VSLNETDDGVCALRAFLSRCLEHGIGFPDARRGAEEYLELPFPFPFFFTSDPVQKLIGTGPFFFHYGTP